MDLVAGAGKEGWSVAMGMRSEATDAMAGCRCECCYDGGLEAGCMAKKCASQLVPQGSGYRTRERRASGRRVGGCYGRRVRRAVAQAHDARPTQRSHPSTAHDELYNHVTSDTLHLLSLTVLGLSRAPLRPRSHANRLWMASSIGRRRRYRPFSSPLPLRTSSSPKSHVLLQALESSLSA